MGFMILENSYDWVNKEAPWQVLKMYDVGGTFLNRIKSMYVNVLAWLKVDGGECVCYRIDWGETRLYHVPLAL